MKNLIAFVGDRGSQQYFTTAVTYFVNPMKENIEHAVHYHIHEMVKAKIRWPIETKSYIKVARYRRTDCMLLFESAYAIVMELK